ncbi:uncharacterized protein [Diadema antillarum]|uniref:uncharacterized protein n=1 Tax=Diadema antillarum TaxID=105358 RepID=UPI003A8C3C27
MEGGQEALHSMITQFKAQIKGLKTQNKHLSDTNKRLSDTVKQLQLEQSQGNPSGKATGLENGSGESYGTELEAKSPGASSQSEVSLGCQSEPGSNGGDVCAVDVSAGIHVSGADIQFGEEAGQLFREVVHIHQQLLKEKDSLERRRRGQEVYIKQSKAAVKHALEFLHLLEELTSHVQGHSEGTATELPIGIRTILGEGDSGVLVSVVRRVWRVLLWSLYNVSEDKKILPSVSEDDIDVWYNVHKQDLQRNVENPDKELMELHTRMCSDFDIIKSESDGLARSILMPQEDSLDQPEDEPAENSELAVTELLRFKIMLESMAKAVGTYHASGEARRRKESLERQESELYLPQKESLETYDLGNMLMTTNSVIESLSNKVTVLESERRLCKNCRRHLEDGPSMAGPGDANYPMFKKSSLLASRFLSGSPVSPPQALSSGLRSGESTSNVSPGAPGGKSAFQPVHQTVATRNGQLLPPRPVPGMFHGIRGPLPPRQLTILQNSNLPARSKSYSGPEGALSRKKELVNQEANVKSSSWESVFPPATGLAKTNGVVPRKVSQEDWHIESNLSHSDSDEDYEVRGPPDTPPEVRAMDFQRRRSNMNEVPERVRLRGGGVRRPSNFDDTEETWLHHAHHPYSNAVSREAVHHDPYVPHYVHSQVQQCTGDNVNSQQDMLLPSSVEWSTIQLKDGGIPSPTLENMRGSSAMRFAEQSIRDRRCAICYCQFKGTSSRADIIAHIRKHMHRDSPDGSDTEDGHHGDVQASAATGSGGSGAASSKEGMLLKQCPVCDIKFPAYVPLQARQSHINLHFEGNGGGVESFEIIGEMYGSAKE